MRCYSKKVISKSTVFGTLIALTLAVISVISVSAASPLLNSDSGNRSPVLEAKWKNELSSLERYKFLDSQVAKWIREWLTTNRSHHQRSKKYKYANEVHSVLQHAEVIVANHAGFDEKGRVINQIAATQSVRDLTIDLRILRSVFIHKFQHHRHKYSHSYAGH